MNILILRGLPGSGKSTWATAYVLAHPRTLIVSADQSHTRDDGVYDFKPENATAAHNDCLRRFLVAIQSGEYLTVIVDNTNTQAFEFAPYYRLAEALGHTPRLIEFRISPELSVSRNIHGVPEQTIYRMFERWQSAPPWWSTEVVA